MNVAILSPSKYFRARSDDDTQGFSCVSFRLHVVCVNKPEVLVTSEGYHVIVAPKTCTTRMLRWVEGYAWS
jgi:hypothetical protein